MPNSPMRMVLRDLSVSCISTRCEVELDYEADTRLMTSTIGAPIVTEGDNRKDRRETIPQGNVDIRRSTVISQPEQE